MGSRRLLALAYASADLNWTQPKVKPVSDVTEAEEGSENVELLQAGGAYALEREHKSVPR
jgi:hypothetical protein